MATLTKKHMLFAAELVARKWREVLTEYKKDGDKVKAHHAMHEAKGAHEAMTSLFGSFNENFDPERFTDACEIPRATLLACIEDWVRAS